MRHVPESICEHWERRPELTCVPASKLPALDSTNARKLLGWRPACETERVVAETARPYRDFYAVPSSVSKIAVDQIGTWHAEL